VWKHGRVYVDFDTNCLVGRTLGCVKGHFLLVFGGLNLRKKERERRLMGVLKVENRMQKVSKRLFFEVCSRRIQINSLGVKKIQFFSIFRQNS